MRYIMVGSCLARAVKFPSEVHADSWKKNATAFAFQASHNIRLYCRPCLECSFQEIISGHHSFYLTQAAWVNIYDTSSVFCSCRRAVVAIKSRSLYSRLLPVVPHFSPAFSFPLFTRCHFRITHSCTPAFYP